jgi:hypothetical protein
VRARTCIVLKLAKDSEIHGDLDSQPISLEMIEVIQTAEVIHTRFRFMKQITGLTTHLHVSVSVTENVLTFLTGIAATFIEGRKFLDHNVMSVITSAYSYFSFITR